MMWILFWIWALSLVVALWKEFDRIHKKLDKITEKWS